MRITADLSIETLQARREWQGILKVMKEKNLQDLGSICGLGRSPGEGNGYPLQYSGLENSMDRGAWQATVHGVSKSWTRLSDLAAAAAV